MPGAEFTATIGLCLLSPWQYEYSIRDHLGNSRVLFADINEDGTIDENTEILEENHYFPFGMAQSGEWQSRVKHDNRYRYNGIEFDEATSTYQAMFRSYDPAIGRWMQIDPLAELAPDWTPYRNAFNNPLSYIDPFGLFETASDARKHRRQERRDARRSGRQNSTKGAKVRKGKDGRYRLDYKDSDGYVTQNTDGSLEYGTTQTYTGASINATQSNSAEKIRDNGGFVGRFAYNLANDIGLTIQRFNPFDTQTTHLSGNIASKDEYTMGLVNTVSTFVPVARPAKGLSLLMPKVRVSTSILPEGLTMFRVMNAAQFSSQFKGTVLARAHPRIRGTVNRLMNQGSKTVNTQLETGKAAFYPALFLGKEPTEQ